MNWGKENGKLSVEEFEKVHDVSCGCRVELEDLGFCIKVDKNENKVKMPIVRMRCVTCGVSSRKYVEGTAMIRV